MCDQIHNENKEKGFWDKERGFLECVALMHSEISEASENLFYGLKISEKINADNFSEEVADCIIRIMDWFGYTKTGSLMENFVQKEKEPTEKQALNLLLTHHYLSLAVEKFRKPNTEDPKDIPEKYLLECVTHLTTLCDDLERIILEKITYNRSRPYKHGKTC